MTEIGVKTLPSETKFGREVVNVNLHHLVYIDLRCCDLIQPKITGECVFPLNQPLNPFLFRKGGKAQQIDRARVNDSVAVAFSPMTFFP